MRFSRNLRNLISCCGPFARPAVATTPPREETRSLVQQSRSSVTTVTERFPCTKRTNSISTTQWRPSLCAISEDNVIAAVVTKAEQKVKSGKKAARKAGSRVKARVRSYSDEYRRSPMPTVIPAFSPTAFLF
ncbi:PREDICTED: uncharacterized protein LOC104604953 [Nelumbo nucifera]|uniref:Secreted protein n=2 Tax=Nelumbo nucifera TaxID=4432 RepID=A0A822XT50_NELNU|nr:PREDICTED: uncharacterized protein LOC104604953 [Nelumbo nucifera]DAD23192.1 TPA_asm: hypothetical protein HUJ06_024655 [Nelumbo nucifera]